MAWGPGEAMVIEEVELSPPQPMEIRVKVVSTSLCRSDVTAWLSQVWSLLHPFFFLGWKFFPTGQPYLLCQATKSKSILVLGRQMLEWNCAKLLFQLHELFLLNVWNLFIIINHFYKYGIELLGAQSWTNWRWTAFIRDTVEVPKIRTSKLYCIRLRFYEFIWQKRFALIPISFCFPKKTS